MILIQLYKKKQARGIGKSFLANIPPPTCEKSGLELCLAQDAGPLGNLAARQADRQASCLSGNGKCATSERESLKRTVGAPVREVVSGKLPDF